jgi:hypothetical protein
MAEPLENGKSAYVMHARPGLKQFAALETGPYRGSLDLNGRLLVASGKALYEVDGLGTVSEVGGLPGTGPVQFARNALADPDVLMVADNAVWHWKSGTLQQLESDVLPSIVGVCLIRGRFILAAADGRFFYSNINTVTFDALNFYNAEGKPDGLVSVWQRRDEVWLLGTETVELWAPTDDEDDPFSRLGGGALPIGCVSSGSVSENNDDIFWVDNNNQVRRASGQTPKEISPPWVVRTIRDEPDKLGIVGAGITLSGINWYILTGSTFSLLYNMDQNQWSELATGDLQRWRGQGGFVFQGRPMCGDHKSGDIWELIDGHHLDGDLPVVMKLQSALVHANPQPLAIYSLHVDIIPAVGINSEAPEEANPQAMLRISSDGGKSWGRPLYAPIGRIGQQRRVIWRQLGTYERHGVAFELSISSRVAKAVLDAQINGTAGST